MLFGSGITPNEIRHQTSAMGMPMHARGRTQGAGALPLTTTLPLNSMILLCSLLFLFKAHSNPSCPLVSPQCIALNSGTANAKVARFAGACMWRMP